MRVLRHHLVHQRVEPGGSAQIIVQIVVETEVGSGVETAREVAPREAGVDMRRTQVAALVTAFVYVHHQSERAVKHRHYEDERKGKAER